MQKKNHNTSDLVWKTEYIAKFIELESKIPDHGSLATKTALTRVENKIPNISNLVKKQIMTQKVLKFKRKLLIIIMINILQPQSLIL